MGIDSTVTKTGGVGIKATSTADRQGVTIEQVYVRQCFQGLALIGYANSAIRNCEIRDLPTVPVPPVINTFILTPKCHFIVVINFN